jgi:hypothetical protein
VGAETLSVIRRFREVLYLDADNLPVRDPTLLSTRNLPPPGRCSAGLPAALTANAFVPTLAWDVAGVAWRDGPAFESGQYLVDKSAAGAAAADNAPE